MGAHERLGARRIGRFQWVVRWGLVIVLSTAALVIAICVPIIGCSMLTEGVQRMRDASALSERGRYAPGTVLDERAESDGPGTGYKSYIKVRFTAADGSQHTIWGAGENGVGGTVQVHYDPQDPRTAVTDSLAKQRGEGITDIVGGALLFLVPTISYVGWAWSKLRDRRARKRRVRPPA